MADTGPELSLLQRREIEAKIAGPLLRGFAEKFGLEATLQVARDVIAELARRSGADMARDLGETTLEAFACSLERWSEGGALEIDVLDRSPERLSFNVTRCRYAELYRALGLAEYGSSLSCLRDFALVHGFNPDIRLTRTQTIMEGASHCDFRFRGPVAGPSDAPGPAEKTREAETPSGEPTPGP